MASLLHMSFRVKDPLRSAALYVELLDGHVDDSGPVLTPFGVQSVFFGDTNRHPLADSIELWPLHLHWRGERQSIQIHAQPFGHLAVQSAKTYEELAAIAQRHGVFIHKESRGPLGIIPVVYDYEGNFVEFFPAM